MMLFIEYYICITSKYLGGSITCQICYSQSEDLYFPNGKALSELRRVIFFDNSLNFSHRVLFIALPHK